MKMNLLVLALVALLFTPAFAQDDATKKKGKGKGKGKKAGTAEVLTASAQLLKQMEVAVLTEDQIAKVKELGKKHDAEIKKIETDAKLTPELLKKRREAMASMKDSELKGKEKAKAIDEAAGFTAEQAEAFAKATAIRTKMKNEALKLLTEEQKSKLPKTMTAQGGGKAGKGKKKAA